tara:strand:+ start:456 stop:674 length:219 start_codon:yes stop_codon:yes gene_type:complete
MWQVLFTLIFISIAIFVIYPLFKKDSYSKKEERNSEDNQNAYELLENDYNLGLIDKDQFKKEKSRLNNNVSN